MLLFYSQLYFKILNNLNATIGDVCGVILFNF